MGRIFRSLVFMLAAATLLAACQHVRLGGDVPIAPPDESALRVGTHNVHYITTRDQGGPWSVAGWEQRRDELDAAFKALEASVVAFQEMETFAGGSVSYDNLALDWLLARNRDFAAAAVGDPDVFPSTQPILYRRDRLDVIDQGWFFFSSTPDVAYSRGFDGASPSFASWAELRERASGRALTVVNVHFDYGSWQNRRGAAELTAAFARERIADGARVMVVGDLNARAGSRTLETLQGAGLRFAPVEGATYHLNRGLNLFGAIDHLAYGPHVSASGAPMVLRERFGDTWGSDHYPVALDVELLQSDALPDASNAN